MSPTPDEIRAQQKEILARMRGRGRGRGRGQTEPPKRGMNRTEEAYAAHLQLRLLAGEISAFVYEGLKFRLATRCWYTPDFVVMMPDGALQIHETKGHLEDDAAVKLRVFPECWYWFRLFVVRRKAGRWELEERE